MYKKSTVEKFWDYSLAFLVAVIWSSTLVFGVYIIAAYGIVWFQGDMAQWNEVLPGLYDRNEPASTAGIGLHFLAGGIILILGCLQLLEGVRKNFPRVHRWSGRVYITASLFASLGGLTFIAVKGCIGGTVMNIGFTGYGILMGLAAVFTVVHARKGRMKKHRAWAVRLFALAIGSWLYRIDYGLYIGLGGTGGHTDTFDGWFDYFMDFWFYLPNLFVAEVIIAEFTFFKRPWVKAVGTILLLMATAVLCFATYIFVRELWGPGIMRVLG